MRYLPDKHDLSYLKYVLRHKWFVLLAGRKLGVPLWRLCIHDYSKFTRSEWKPYVDKFCRKWTGPGIDHAFSVAVQHHYDHNPHHWQYWMDSVYQEAIMPETYIREMVADWMGAGRAQTGSWEIFDWYLEKAHIMPLSDYTRCMVEYLIFRQMRSEYRMVRMYD